MIRTMTLLALAASTPALAGDFSNADFAPESWSATASPGTAQVAALDADTAALSYDFSPSYSGSGTFSVTAPIDGTVTLDWTYEFFHSWYRVNADLYAWADGPDGTTTLHLVDFYNAEYTGTRTFSGSLALEVHEGFAFGFDVDGDNYDSARTLRGTLTLDHFYAPVDTDGDGLLDEDDQCADTAVGDLVDADGCSIAQYCPAEGDWTNHGEYVSCVAQSAQAFVDMGLLSEDQKGLVVSSAARSSVGKRK